MDLICHRILERVERDRDADAVQVSLAFDAETRDAASFETTTRIVKTVRDLEVKRAFPADDDAPHSLIVNGAEFSYTRDIVKTFAQAWVCDFLEALGECDVLRGSCTITCSHAAGVFYKRRVCIGGRVLRRTVNRLTEAMMQVRGLLDARVR
jgi:hypothetical protein